MALQDEREASHPAAKEVLEILARGGYHSAGPAEREVSIRDAQRAAEEGTRLYTPEDLERLKDSRPTPKVGSSCTVEVVDATTQEAAFEWSRASDVVLLNFASARNPGGGFLGGAKAQEEELCRCSGLYRALLTQPHYYEIHRELRSLLYTDHIIYSPHVPFFRTSTQAALLDEPFFPSVITAPAPNLGAILRNHPAEAQAVQGTFRRRWANILAVAEAHHHPTLILGAWGCGAFRNDPFVAAATAKEAVASRKHSNALFSPFQASGKLAAPISKLFSASFPKRMSPSGGGGGVIVRASQDLDARQCRGHVPNRRRCSLRKRQHCRPEARTESNGAMEAWLPDFLADYAGADPDAVRAKIRKIKYNWDRHPPLKVPC